MSDELQQVVKYVIQVSPTEFFKHWLPGYGIEYQEFYDQAGMSVGSPQRTRCKDSCLWSFKLTTPWNDENSHDS